MREEGGFFAASDSYISASVAASVIATSLRLLQRQWWCRLVMWIEIEEGAAVRRVIDTSSLSAMLFTVTWAATARQIYGSIHLQSKQL
jgi:hypothetical protein